MFGEAFAFSMANRMTQPPAIEETSELYKVKCDLPSGSKCPPSEMRVVSRLGMFKEQGWNYYFLLSTNSMKRLKTNNTVCSSQPQAHWILTKMLILEKQSQICSFDFKKGTVVSLLKQD